MRILIRSIVISLIISLVGKWLADFFLTSQVSIIGDWVQLEYAENPGIAFGVRLPEMLQPFLLVAAVALLLWVALHSKNTALSSVAFGIILGGALGNIVDRLFDARVTDFIHVKYFSIFNFADAAITIGVILLLVEALWSKFHPETIVKTEMNV